MTVSAQIGPLSRPPRPPVAPAGKQAAGPRVAEDDTDSRPRSRRTDSRRLSARATRLRGEVGRRLPGLLHGDGSSAAWGGQVLLVGSGITVAVAEPLLQPDTRGWLALGGVTSLMVLALIVSGCLPWTRLPRSATLAFPLLVCAALLVLAAASPGMAAPLVGVLTLCAAYVGLTQRPGSIVFLLPITAVTFVVCNQGWSRVISVRLIIATVIWTLLSELLARLTSRQAELADALRAAAQTDVLTGVGNRREIDLRLTALSDGDAVVICDLDHFKRLNDSQGHLAGDRVLADFGALLSAELRHRDFAGRFGGEEFILLLPATSTADVLVLTARLRTVWARLHPEVTFSAGVAQCSSHRASAVTLQAADEALYAAKDAGRNQDCVHTSLWAVPPPS